MEIPNYLIGLITCILCIGGLFFFFGFYLGRNLKTRATESETEKSPKRNKKNKNKAHGSNHAINVSDIPTESSTISSNNNSSNSNGSDPTSEYVGETASQSNTSEGALSPPKGNKNTNHATNNSKNTSSGVKSPEKVKTITTKEVISMDTESDNDDEMDDATWLSVDNKSATKAKSKAKGKKEKGTHTVENKAPDLVYDASLEPTANWNNANLSGIHDSDNDDDGWEVVGQGKAAKKSTSSSTHKSPVRVTKHLGGNESSNKTIHDSYSSSSSSSTSPTKADKMGHKSKEQHNNNSRDNHDGHNNNNTTNLDRQTTLTEHIKVPARHLGSIIGTKGNTLNMLQKVSGAEIILPKPKDKEVENTSTVKHPPEDLDITIIGPNKGVGVAMRAINDLCTKGFSALLEGSDFSEGFMTVHPAYLSEIVGHKGACIRAIQDQLQVRLQVPQGISKDVTSVRVGIAGPKDKVKRCKDLIKDLMKYHHTEITHPGLVHVEIDVPKIARSHIIGKKGAGISNIQDKFKVFISMPTADTLNSNVVVVGNDRDTKAAQQHIMNIVEEQEAKSKAQEEAAAEANKLASLMTLGAVNDNPSHGNANTSTNSHEQEQGSVVLGEGKGWPVKKQTIEPIKDETEETKSAE